MKETENERGKRERNGGRKEKEGERGKEYLFDNGTVWGGGSQNQ